MGRMGKIVPDMHLTGNQYPNIQRTQKQRVKEVNKPIRNGIQSESFQ